MILLSLLVRYARFEKPNPYLNQLSCLKEARIFRALSMIYCQVFARLTA